MITEAIFLASSLSLDAFVASFAYGSNRIKMPVSSVVAINLVCSGILGLSLLLGSFIRPYLSPAFSSAICFAILFLIGIIKLIDNATKAFIRRHNGVSKHINFSCFNFTFLLSVYADPEKADVDGSKSMSFGEACSLAVALSLDGMAVGFGAVLGDTNGWAVFIASLFTGVAAVLLGAYLGRKLSARLKCNISWLSGAILIVLAFLKIC